jgi:hypothetical protein
MLASLQKCQLQRIAAFTELLSIEIKAREQRLKSGTFETIPGQRDII